MCDIQKWLMSSSNGPQDSLQTHQLFQLFSSCSIQEEVWEWSPGGLPTASSNSAVVCFSFFFLLDGKHVVAWASPYMSKRQCKMLIILLFGVNSSEYYTPSTPLCDSTSSLIRHQLIATTLYLYWFLFMLLPLQVSFVKDHLLLMVSNHKWLSSRKLHICKSYFPCFIMLVYSFFMLCIMYVCTLIIIEYIFRMYFLWLLFWFFGF